MRTTRTAIQIVLCAFFASAAWAEDLQVDSLHIAPEGAGWANVVHGSRAADRGRDRVIVSGTLRYIGADDEFGALCVVAHEVRRGQTSAREGEFLWIDPEELKGYTAATKLQRTEQTRELQAATKLINAWLSRRDTP